MMKPTRRDFFATLATSAAALWLEPVRAVARDTGPIRIKDVDLFRIEIPTPREDVGRGLMNTCLAARVDTDVGVRGYGFAEYLTVRMQPNARLWEFNFDFPPSDYVRGVIRPALVGKDLFAIQDHLKAGLLEWGGVEHALWDAIGRIAGQPVYRLLGGSKHSIPVYLTYVWPGKEDQSDVPYQLQAEMAARIQKAGFRAMKIRAWRARPLDDVEACAEIRAAVGPDFAIMFDRTAHISGQVWDYNTALLVAQGLEKHGAYWLEEPFARTDFFSPARLARDVDIPITGGESYQGLDPFRECLVHSTYDILQPDGIIAGGIFTVRKVAAMAEGFHTRVVMHGTMGLSLAGWLQANAALGGQWQELAIMYPPLLPEEQWSPALKILKTPTLFTFRNGEIQVPQGPGLGLDVKEEAVEEFRVR